MKNIILLMVFLLMATGNVGRAQQDLGLFNNNCLIPYTPLRVAAYGPINGNETEETVGQGTDCRQAEAEIVIEEREYRHDYFDIIYPYFRGIKNQLVQDRINRDMATMVEKFIADNANDFTKTAVVRYEVHCLSSQLLSFTVTSYIYTGGAHGFSYREGYTYDLHRGLRCEFSDLFEFNDAARASINAQIVAQIQANNIPTLGPFKGIGDKPYFYIAADGQPVIFFQQYEIGPYAVGILEFPVSVKWLNREGNSRYANK